MSRSTRGTAACRCSWSATRSSEAGGLCPVHCVPVVEGLARRVRSDAVLDWVRNLRGDAIPRWDGRLVSSKVDPWKEAETWIAARAARIHDAGTVLVFGIGGGFHVARLGQLYPGKPMIVIEAEAAFLSSPSPLIRDLVQQIPVHAGVDPPALLGLADVQTAVKDVYAVLRHPPALRISPMYYQRASAVLLGREAECFNNLSRIRGSACRLPSSPRPPDEPAAAISVRTIVDVAVPAAAAVTEETRAWLCLRELLT